MYKDNKFRMEIMSDFWSLMNSFDDDNVTMEYHESEATIYLYFYNSFGKELEKFMDSYLTDNRIKCILTNTDIIINCKDFMYGYGFTLKELWDFGNVNCRCAVSHY